MSFSHFIDGYWIKGSGEPFHSLNPSTGQILWQGASATEEEIDQAVLSSHSAFPAWSILKLEERFACLEAFRQMLLKHEQSLATTISTETGKPLWESRLEVKAMASKIEISLKAYHERCPDQSRLNISPQGYTRHKPHGPIAVLGPFNFPGHLPNGHIVPALLAGNTVVFKPSDKTPRVAIHTLELWEEAKLPKGVLNLVQGKGKVGETLALHPLIRSVCFTGSMEVGCHLSKILAREPSKLLALEMGGNNPLIVGECLNAKAAMMIIIQSAYLTAGQRCTCARRLILPQGSQGDEILREVQTAISKISIGPYTDIPEPFMGPVIDNKSAEELLNSQFHLKEKGGICLLEMKRIDPQLPFLTPGLIDVTSIKNREDREFFGPLLQVIRVQNFQDGLKEANNTHFGLAAGLISSNPKEYQAFWETIEAGIINWNTPLTGASSEAPFGGIKWSGNYRPSAYYAADYCSYPVASLEQSELKVPENFLPGLNNLKSVFKNT